ncbi:MAG: ABC transporter ATP-binding protein [Nitrospirae bacterium]|nr:ABC transporter ATP-binding protein [Nitrospirota bacterium]
MVNVEGVSKVYNSGLPDEMRALTDISFEVFRGEFVVFKGPSGSGKTTLLAQIGCMSRPTSGKITVGQRDVAKLPERFLTEIRRSTFGFIFQQFNLIKGITVLENVMLPLYPLTIPYSEIKERANKVLEQLNIIHKKDFKTKQLSGGEQQRVAIARALINNPEIILADEPTAHLDTKLSTDLIEIIHNLNQQGKTVIIASHDPLIYDSPYVMKTVEMRDGLLKEVVIR